jgi:DNA-binding NarL/FixJ family response regulator
MMKGSIPGAASEETITHPGRVLLGEADDAERERLRVALDAFGYECTCVARAFDVRERLAWGAIDVIVANQYFPDDDQLSYLEGLGPALDKGTALILTTSHPSLPTAVRAIRLGAVDYLFKPIAVEELVEAVARGLKRARLLQARSTVAANSSAVWALLSDRECEVVRGLYAGNSPQLIAEALSISQYTVRNHLRSIYSKLGVHSQRELLSLGAPAAPKNQDA